MPVCAACVPAIEGNEAFALGGSLAWVRLYTSAFYLHKFAPIILHFHQIDSILSQIYLIQIQIIRFGDWNPKKKIPTLMGDILRFCSGDQMTSHRRRTPYSSHALYAGCCDTASFILSLTSHTAFTTISYAAYRTITVAYESLFASKLFHHDSRITPTRN